LPGSIPKMKPAFNKLSLFVALAMLILLIGGATHIVIKLLHLDSYKEQILSELQKALNRQVTYETGTVSFRFGPQFVFTHVAVKEKEGTANFISADRLVVNLAFIPLLEKTLVVSEIVLDKPLVNISRDQSGVFNFSDLLEERKEEIALQIKGVRLRNGTIAIIDRRAAPQGLVTTLADADLTLDQPGRGKSNSFKLSATIAHQGKRGSLTLAGSAKVPARDKPLGDTELNAVFTAKNINVAHFWPYYSSYVPFRQILGQLNLDGSLKGKLRQFSSKGKVRVTAGQFDYPQVFHNVLTPRNLNLSYDMELNPTAVLVKSLDLTVDGLNVKGSCAIRDINTGDPRITARARTSTFDLQNFAQYIPYGIIVKDTADYIEQHIKGGIYRLDDGRLDGRVSQIAHMERGDNYNVLYIFGRVEKGLVTYGPDVPTFNNIKGTLEMRGKDFNLMKMSGNFGGSPFTLDGKITDYPLDTPSGYPFTMKITPRQPELAWLLGKGKGGRLGFSGESTLLLSGAGFTSGYNLGGEWNLTPSSYSYPELINKPTGRANTLSFKGSINKQEARLSSLQFNLEPMVLAIGASYRFTGKRQLALDIKSNQFPVHDVAAMLPRARKYQAAGRLQGTIHGEGQDKDLTDLHWGGNILFVGFSCKPGTDVKTVSNLSGTVNFSGDTWETQQLQGRLGNSFFYAKGKLVGLTNPALNMTFSSPSLDPADLGLHVPQKELRLARVQGNIALKDNSLQIKSLTSQLNNSVVNLKGTVDDLRNPSVDVSVTSPYLEMEDVILLCGLEPIKKKEAAAAPLEIRASIQADAGKARGIDFEKLHSTATYENNILYLHPVECSTLDGHFSGRVRIDFGASGAPRYQLNYNLKKVSAESFTHAIGIRKGELTGTLTIQGELTAKGKTGEELKKTALGSARILFEEGSIKKFAILSKIFSILNVSQLLKFQLPDMVAGGMPYNSIKATFAIRDGIAACNDLYVDSDAMNISVVGKVDLVRDELDATIGVKPLQTVDKVVSHIPIVGWILTGKNKALITAYFEAKGKLADPTVRAIPVKSMARGVFDIFRRAFELPARLITDTGEVIIGK
jgi:AsmA-like C-terminal region/AsmA family/Protein of unknown function